MSERTRFHGPEQSHEPLDHERARQMEAEARKRLEQAAEAHRQATPEEIHKIEEQVERKAHTAEELHKTLEHETHDGDTQKAYHYAAPDSIPRAIAQARKQLKPVDRALSKVIHNPKVDAVSTVGGATVARPSGILYGSLFSLIASFGFYIISIKYGYEYNAFIGILAFVGGFFFGLFVEMLLAAFRPAHK